MTDVHVRRLSIYIESRPMLVAGRLRRLFEKRGFVALPGGKAAPETGFTLAIGGASPTSCWLIPDIVDAVPDELGKFISDALQCRVVSVAKIGPIQAYEVLAQGRTIEKLAFDGEHVVEELQSPHTSDVMSGTSVAECLERSGIAGAQMAFSDLAHERRTITLGFAPKAGSKAHAIEIDPTLSCPLCDAAMRRNHGRYGTFWGCVTFPECRGRLTEKQADAQRQS